MPVSQLPIHRVSIAVVLALVLALAASTAAFAGQGAGGKAPKCKKAPSAGRKKSCGAPPGPTGYRTVERHFQLVVPHSSGQEGLSEVKTVLCPSNQQVLGGGAEVQAENLSVALSAPNEATDGWSAQLVNLSPSTDALASLKVYAICVSEGR